MMTWRLFLTLIFSVLLALQATLVASLPASAGDVRPGLKGVDLSARDGHLFVYKEQKEKGRPTQIYVWDTLIIIRSRDGALNIADLAGRDIYQLTDGRYVGLRARIAEFGVASGVAPEPDIVELGPKMLAGVEVREIRYFDEVVLVVPPDTIQHGALFVSRMSAMAQMFRAIGKGSVATDSLLLGIDKIGGFPYRSALSDGAVMTFIEAKAGTFDPKTVLE